MVGAIVNGSIVSLDYVLQNNDIVKINTNKSSTPSREWINMAYTASAKNKIKAYFNKIDKEENLKKGEDLLLKELRRKKIPAAQFYEEENIDKVFDEFHVGDLTELYIGIGSGKFSAISVVNVIGLEEQSKEEILLNKVNIHQLLLTKTVNLLFHNNQQHDQLYNYKLIFHRKFICKYYIIRKNMINNNFIIFDLFLI
jgi:GTP pyrophosphokinase